MSKNRDASRRRLVREVVCPHCWTHFPPENALWISVEPTLLGDMKLGDTESIRFLPTLFDSDGRAIDERGFSCHDIACPHCHLRIPFSVLDSPPLFMSIVGAPACGKSYYLASSTYVLRRVLSSKFDVNYIDADPQMNSRLQEYEALQFGGRAADVVKIEKTEQQGDLYNAVVIDGQNYIFPQPFVFLASPGNTHPNLANAETASRLICLYDNAGESYLPTKDADQVVTPVTRHLAHSGCVFFLFDPTQNAGFRDACRRLSNDPQLNDSSPAFRTSPLRQETVFAETIRRIRMYRKMATSERYENPLIVIVPKADVWRKLIPSVNLESDPFSKLQYRGQKVRVLNITKVRAASALVRSVLLEHAPDFVMSAESFASDVVYIPVSATGSSPIVDAATNESGFRVADMNPMWITVPMIYALSRMAKGIVAAHEMKEEDEPAPSVQKSGQIVIDFNK